MAGGLIIRCFHAIFVKRSQKGRYRLAAAGIVQSLLLVKDFGAKGSMSHSETFISNPDVPSIVCSTVVTCKRCRAKSDSC